MINMANDSPLLKKVKALRRQANTLLHQAEKLEEKNARYSHIFAFLLSLPKEMTFDGASLSKQITSITPLQGLAILYILYELFPEQIIQVCENDVLFFTIPRQLMGE